MKIKYLILGLCISILMVFVSCKDKEPHINTTALNTVSHNIKVVESDDNLELTIEVLSDKIDNLTGDFPNIDLINIYIDKNANGVIDSDLDWGIGVLEYNTICTFFIKDSVAVSGCGLFDSEATLTSDFVSSSLSSDNHVIWDISIPKKDLDDSKPLNMVVKTFAASEGYTTFPTRNSQPNTAILSFNEVLSIDW